MKLMDTQWQFYGESAIPLWMVFSGLLLCFVLTIRWLRRENKQSSVVGRLLPVSLCLLVLLVSWRVYRPVAVKICTWRHEAQRLLYVDTSASMDMPVAAEANHSAALDVAQLYEPQALIGRPFAARRLGAELQTITTEAGAQLKAIENIREQVLQGLPLGSESHGSIQRYKEWAQRTKAALRQHMSELDAAIADLPKDQVSPVIIDAIAQFRQLSQVVESLHEQIGDLAGRSLALVSTSVDALIKSALSLPQHLVQLQESMDVVFRARNENTLRPLLEAAITKPRREIALRMADLIQAPGVRMIHSKSPRDLTDIHGGLRQVLADYHDQVVSDLAVLSDGGNNCPPNAQLFRELKRTGVSLTLIGIGTNPIEDADLAILDWELPRVVVTRREIALQVRVKTPPDVKMPFKLSLASGSVEWASAQAFTTGETMQMLRLAPKAPEPGRYKVRLSIDADDGNRRNNEVRFVLDVVARTPQMLLVGDTPDWDTSYLALASQGAGLIMRQVYPSAQPRRGEGAEAIPDTPFLWSRNQVVILKGAAYKGFSRKDADDLFKSVNENGTCLAVITDEHSSYLDALAKSFGWSLANAGPADRTPPPPGSGLPTKTNSTPIPLEDSSIRLAAEAEHLPLARLGMDAAQTRRTFASFGRCDKTFEVPPQALTILENTRGKPLLSLGFYGRGKVLLWGMKGTYPLREYQKSQNMDRFLRQLLGNLAAGVFASEQDRVASYPELPVVGRQNLLIALTSSSQAIVGAEAFMALHQGKGNAMGRFSPAVAEPLSVKCEGDALASVTLQPVSNPGMEELYYEFNETFMKQLAASAGGLYLSFMDAASNLPQFKVHTWESSTSQRYPLADHWLLLAAIALTGIAHWVLRKLAGLAI